jgi:hypothetical protein
MVIMIRNRNGKNFTPCVIFLAKFRTWLNQKMAQFRTQLVIFENHIKIDFRLIPRFLPKNQ